MGLCGRDQTSLVEPETWYTFTFWVNLLFGVWEIRPQKFWPALTDSMFLRKLSHWIYNKTQAFSELMSLFYLTKLKIWEFWRLSYISIINSRIFWKNSGFFGKTQGFFGKTRGIFFTKTQGILRKTQGFANSELDIVAEKRPKKSVSVSNP